MRLYRKQIPRLTEDIVEALIANDIVEVEPGNEDEVELDIQAVLKEYLRADNEIAEEANEMKAETDLSFGAAKNKIAERKGIGVGENAVGYIIEQIIEMLFHSNFVEEIFAADHEIRAELAPVIREHMKVQEEMEEEAEKQLKHVEEGTQEWDIEYQKVMERLRRTKDLE
jgi:hypothetical protein